jgi:hypothetical protein
MSEKEEAVTLQEDQKEGQNQTEVRKSQGTGTVQGMSRKFRSRIPAVQVA